MSLIVRAGLNVKVIEIERRIFDSGNFIGQFGRNMVVVQTLTKVYEVPVDPKSMSSGLTGQMSVSP